MFSKQHDTDDCDAITVWEVTPGALEDPRVGYIINRIKGQLHAPDLGVRRYPLGVLDNGVLDPAFIDPQTGIYQFPHTDWYWKDLGNNEYIATKKKE
jgi:hypothetical protein